MFLCLEDKYQDIVLLGHMGVVFLFFWAFSILSVEVEPDDIPTKWRWGFILTTTPTTFALSRFFLDIFHSHRLKMISHCSDLHFSNRETISTVTYSCWPSIFLLQKCLLYTHLIYGWGHWIFFVGKSNQCFIHLDCHKSFNQKFSLPFLRGKKVWYLIGINLAIFLTMQFSLY